MSEELLQEIRKIEFKKTSEVIDFFRSNDVVEAGILDKIEAAEKLEIMSSHYPYKCKIKRGDYEKQKKMLQTELLKLQGCVKKFNKKIAIVFEGRDAAGKGGTIKRIMEHINPRGARVVALVKPSEEELTQWYFQRYIKEMPAGGEIVCFDRSWYNRAGVERVMGFCTEDEYNLFLKHVPRVENMLIESHLELHKFWFSVSQEEQIRRFIDRIVDPLKRWKISAMDLSSINQWKSYTEAKEQMFFRTDTDRSPWIVIRSDDKKRAHIQAMKYLLHKSEYNGKNEEIIGEIDSNIIGPGECIYEEDELIHRQTFNHTGKSTSLTF